MTRRKLLTLMIMAGLESSFAQARKLAGSQGSGSWKKYTGNPVLGGQYGTIFDICVLREEGLYRMWVSWRPKKSIALTESKDGIHWSVPEIVLPPDPQTGWEGDMNRPVVVRRDDGLHMWYTGQADGKSKIGYAKSANGRDWVRQSSKPVLEATLPWEGVAVMCPHVMWDRRDHVWKLWYSGGEQYEPNAIGYASSSDGLHWDQISREPGDKACTRGRVGKGTSDCRASHFVERMVLRFLHRFSRCGSRPNRLSEVKRRNYKLDQASGKSNCPTNPGRVGRRCLLQALCRPCRWPLDAVVQRSK